MKKNAALIALGLFFLSPAYAADPAPAAAPATPIPAPPAVIVGNAVAGARVFKIRCAMCHSLVENKIGPRLSGVAGRKAGSLPDYNYSLGLKKSGLVWDTATLERWLANPVLLVSDTKMLIKLDNPQDRADVAAYLQNAPMPAK